MEWIASYIPDPWTLLVVVAIIGSVLTLAYWSRDHRQLRHVRYRFVGGIPWGTLITLLALLAFYLVIQDGRTDWEHPVYYPYIATSYFYPFGQLTAGFAHASAGHLLSNLLGLAIFGTIAEYAWGHYSHDAAERPKKPWVRIACIPVISGIIALTTAIFSWGPVLGFSGAVFAFAGFAVVRYPVLTIIGMVFQSALVLLTRAILSPVTIHEVTESVDVPGWAGIGFQGHGMGFLLGIVLAILLWYRRDDPLSPGAVRVWGGILLVGSSMGLWAIWTTAGDDVYVLYRGLGVILLVGVAWMVAGALQADSTPTWGGISWRHVAICAICIPIIAMSTAAIPMGLQVVGPMDPVEERITIEDYEIYYVTNHTHSWQPGMDLPVIGDTASEATRSGVFIRSSDRQLQLRLASSSQLAREGEARGIVGGVGWRSEVLVERSAWNPVGNDSVYRVTIANENQSSVVFTAPSQQVDSQIDHHQIALRATETGFGIDVRDPDGTEHQVDVPAKNESVTVSDLTIARDGSTLVASTDGTRVVIATRR